MALLLDKSIEQEITLEKGHEDWIRSFNYRPHKHRLEQQWLSNFCGPHTCCVRTSHERLMLFQKPAKLVYVVMVARFHFSFLPSVLRGLFIASVTLYVWWSSDMGKEIAHLPCNSHCGNHAWCLIFVSHRVHLRTMMRLII